MIRSDIYISRDKQAYPHCIRTLRYNLQASADFVKPYIFGVLDKRPHLVKNTCIKYKTKDKTKSAYRNVI